MPQPFNDQLHNHAIFTNNRFSELSLISLEPKDDFEINNLYFIYIDIQILWLITFNQSGVNVYPQKSNISNQNYLKKFNHMILEIVQYELYKGESSCLVYIMEANNQNDCLCKKINPKENGEISFVYFIWFPCPTTINY